MHVKLRNCMKILWGMEQKGVNYQAWTLINGEYLKYISSFEKKNHNLLQKQKLFIILMKSANELKTYDSSWRGLQKKNHFSTLIKDKKMN
jgi:hypothetical protein